MLLHRPSFRRSTLLITALLLTLLYFLSRIPRLANSHLYDISYESYFERQFHVYILTSSCERFTSDAVSQFPLSSITLVPNAPDTPQCDALNTTQLPFNHEGVSEGTSKDRLFRLKYAQALDSCAAGQYANCLILEDDVVFLHTPHRTVEVLVENTIPLFNDGEVNAYDCSKRGWGWLPSSPTGMGSQCRVFSKFGAPCLSSCLRENYLVEESGEEMQLDGGLVRCQVRCGLRQKRFLLVVHGGLGSTMERVEEGED
ncbi:hypothetical protein BDV06DRAFT_221044 [Aspergillus oleicola]